GKGNIVRAGTETLKRSAGYNLVNLICGSEGTLGIITEASFKLLPEPAFRKTLLIGFNNFRELISRFTDFMKQGVVPSNAEFIDSNTLKVIKSFFPEEISSNSPCLLLELDGITENTVNYQIEVIKKTCNKNLVYEGIECEKAWTGRKKLRLELAKVKPNVFSEDFVLKYSCIADFIEYSENLLKLENICFYNFGHIIDGNIHFSVVFENSDEKNKLHEYIKKLSSYVIKKGGTISGEHGIGLYKKEFLEEENSNVVNYMRQIKKIFDPHNVLNRGKVI
ncbi:MAG: FAD-binding oxidoreductase, partial [Candidatus Muiribacteriota bacterium]